MYEGQDTCKEEGLVGGPTLDMPIPEYYSVKIEHAENGFIISIGCKVFVSKDWLEVSSRLQEYWKDPKKALRDFKEDEK